MRYLIVFLMMFTASSALAGVQSSVYVLTSSDADILSGGFQYALDRSQNQQAVDWNNPATGLSGSTVPLRSYQTSYGQVCREYLATVQLDGALQQAFGTACRQADGRWKIAGEKPVKRAQQALKFVYVNQPRQQLQQVQLTQQGCPFVSSPAHSDRTDVQQRQPGQNFHSDFFHEQFRNYDRGVQPTPQQPRVAPQEPSKLLKLVAY